MILNNEKKLNPTTKTAGVEQEFQKIAGKEASSVLEELGCTTNGISDEEREERLAKYGYNDLSAMQKHGVFYLLFLSYAACILNYFAFHSNLIDKACLILYLGIMLFNLFLLNKKRQSLVH